MKRLTLLLLGTALVFSCTKNTPPVATFSVTPITGTTDSLFTFDAGASYDAETPVEQLRFRWDFDSDGSWDTELTANSVVTHQFAQSATYNTKLEVRDVNGLANFETLAFWVGPRNNPPAIESFVAEPDSVYPGDTVNLAFRVSDFDGDEIVYLFQKPAGTWIMNLGTGLPKQWIAPSEPAEYHLTLKISDLKESDSDSVRIVVGSGNNGPCELFGHTIHLVHNREISITGRGGENSMSLDFDGDGNGDFEFRLDAWSQLSGGGWSNASIYCLNGTYDLNTYTKQDTTWQSDTTLYRDGSYWSSKIAAMITRTVSCRQLHFNDSPLSINHTVRIKSYPFCGKQDAKGEWSKGETFLYKFTFVNEYWLSEIARNADTVWLMNQKRIQDCNLFPYDTTYIGFRKSESGKTFRGWAKVLVKPWTIKVFESEVQI